MISIKGFLLGAVLAISPMIAQADITFNWTYPWSDIENEIGLEYQEVNIYCKDINNTDYTNTPFTTTSIDNTSKEVVGSSVPDGVYNCVSTTTATIIANGTLTESEYSDEITSTWEGGKVVDLGNLLPSAPSSLTVQ